MAPTYDRVVTLYLAGVGVSVVGDTAMMLAAAIWMKELTGSDSLAALTTLCLWGPNLMAAWLGGLSDRLRPGVTLVVFPVLLAGCLGTLIVAPRAWLPGLLFVLMTLYGVHFVVIAAAEGALLPRLLDRERLARVNGYRAGLQEGGGKVAAPALGAGVFAILGPSWVVAATMGALVLAALLFRRLDRVTGRLSAARDLAATTDEGVDHRLAGLRRFEVAVGLGMFASGANGALLFKLVEEDLGRQPTFIGVTTVAAGVGALIMGPVSGRVIGRVGVAHTAAGGLALAALGWTLLASGGVAGAILGSLLGGAGLPVALVSLITFVQTHAEPACLGATLAAASAWASTPLPVGIVAGALAVPAVPATVGYVASAGLGLLGALIMLRARRSH